MNNKEQQPEHLAAILAEMRADVADGENAFFIRADWLALCDRIEAAYKREHAEWHAETDAAKEERNRIACRMRYEFAAKCRNCTERATGNAAAMREALERIVNLAPEYPAHGVDWNALAAEAFLTASSALAAPARNCDRFANGTETGIAFRAERHGVDDDAFWPSLVNWLFAPAEGGTK